MRGLMPSATSENARYAKHFQCTIYKRKSVVFAPRNPWRCNTGVFPPVFMALLHP
ncbi:hypothetical protein M404DRAFT_1005237, partial [Pisolithus tinctorius Marx 270]